MNTHFIVGRRYYNNTATDAFHIVKERYTRSSCRWVTISSDLGGEKMERKVHIKDGVEYINVIDGSVPFNKTDDKHLIFANNEATYTLISDKEQRFLSGEEVYVSLDELKRWIDKLPLTSNMGFKLQRDPHELNQ